MRHAVLIVILALSSTLATSTTLYDPVPSHPTIGGRRWELYLYAGSSPDNGAASSALAYRNNPGGYGTLDPHPTDGLAKMAHATFDERCFREILAVDGVGTWAYITKSDGGCIPASDAFGPARHGYDVQFNDGHSFPSAPSPIARRGGNTQYTGGPIYDDELGSGHMSNFMLMCINGGCSYPNRGGVTGNQPTGNGRSNWQDNRASMLPGRVAYQNPNLNHYNFANGNGLSIWAWYGRAPLPPPSPPSPALPSDSSVGVIIGVAGGGGAVVFLLALALIIICMRKGKKATHLPSQPVQQNQIEMGSASSSSEPVAHAMGMPVPQSQFGAKFDVNTGQPIPKFDPATGKQNWA